MRILQVSDAYYPFPGGVSEHMHHLTLSLRKRGHQVTVLTAKYNGKNFEEGVVRIGKVRTFIMNFAELTWTFSLNLPKDVKNFLNNNKFDVIHTHGPLAPNLPFLALHYGKGIQVATFHTAFVGFNWYKVSKFFFRKHFHKLDACICVSKKAFSEISPHFSGNKYVLIPNGIDTERFNKSGEKIKKFEKFRFRILYVGRLEPRKGLPVLISAFKKVHNRIPCSVLIVVGKGPFDEEYRKMIDEKIKDSVFFEGFVPPRELPKYYRTCDIYCSPALGGETFGIVLLEGMASGACVVASDIDGYRDVIKHGKTGILFEKENSDQLAEWIYTLYKNRELKEKISEAGSIEAQKYDWSKIAAYVENLYIQLKTKQ